MNKNMKIYIAIWVVTAITVCVGIFITRSANCLWAMFIPTLCNPCGDNNDDEENYDEE